MAITPYLYYEDLGGVLTFLTKAFGFRKHGPQMRDADGRLRHATMKHGSSVIMMGEPPSGYRNPKHLGQATQSLYVTTTGIDRHFERARRAGAHILEEPTNTEYGHRRYRVTDLEGHEWCFAQPLPRRTRGRGAKSAKPKR